jgi:hypothetical protein
MGASLIWNLITQGTNPPPKNPPQTPLKDYQLYVPDNYQLETKPYGLGLPSYCLPMERLYDDSFKSLKPIYKHERGYRQVQI